MKKTILYNEDARQALKKGMDILTEAVAVTLGPKGRNVVLEKKSEAPQIINDGVSIAKEIELEGKIENTGVSLIRQAAAKTNDIAGDGTTTATIIASAIIKEGMKNIASGANPMSIKYGIEKGTNFVIQQIVDLSEPIINADSIFQVATIASGNDLEVAKMLTESSKVVGKDGIITLEENKSSVTELEIIEGMRFNNGFISPYFINNTERMEATYDNPYILITDKKIISTQQDLVPILEEIQKSKRPLLIIADNVEKGALATLILNKLQGIVDVVAIKAPGFGAQRKLFLDDIAVLTAGTVISSDAGLSFDSLSTEMLGTAKRIIVTKNSTTIISEGNKETIKKHCNSLRRQAENETSAYQKENIEKRIARLLGGVAIIKVGAATETELKDKKLRLEDAINATQAAIEEGIVPGGGSTLAHLAINLRVWAKRNLIDDELTGAFVLAKAIEMPLKRIAENAGRNGSIILQKVQKSNLYEGYDAKNDRFGDLFRFGIIDPAKVTRTALRNSSSIASMILTTECIIMQ